MKKTIGTIAFLMGTCLLHTAPSYAQSVDINVIIADQVRKQVSSTPSRTATRRATPRPTPSPKVQDTQEALNYFRFEAGAADGIAGRKTREAIGRFQSFVNQPASGYLTDEQYGLLVNAHRTSMQSVLNANNVDTTTLRNALVASSVGTTSRVAEVAANTKALEQLTTATQSQTNSADIMADEIAKLSDQLSLLTAVLEHQKQKTDTDAAVQTNLAIQVSIDRIVKSRDLLIASYQTKYLTPVYPVNANLGISALKASEIFPKIPYYLPGTTEIGEMWVEPTITDSGVLIYLVKFIDNAMANGRIKETIDVRSELLPELATSLRKVFEWSEQANEAGIRRNFEKVAYCFEADFCGKRGTGFTSSEVRFAIYEDGSTAVKIQKNKGGFSVFYNLSVESGLLFAAYLDYMHEVGEREFKAGAMTDDELNAMFK